MQGMTSTHPSLDELRAKLRALQPEPVSEVRQLPSGWDGWDDLMGGIPQPALWGCWGPSGSGVTGVGLQLAIQLTRAGCKVAWVDPLHQFNPDRFLQEGGAPEHLLWVRPEPSQVGWVVEQLLAAGALELVLLDQATADRAQVQRWQRAARKGASSLGWLGHRSFASMRLWAHVELRSGRAIARGRGVAGAARTVPLESVIR